MINNKIEETLLKYNMLDNTDKIIVALSGGADSMTLLHFLLQYCKNKNITVMAAHINHCLRGDESKRDEMFVRDWCKKNNVTLYVKVADIKSIAKEKNIGLEECGREVRYEFLNQLCDKYTKIATAHTASDNTETLLFRLSRGTGMKGACGIPPIRDNIIRPLVYVTREEIEAYCEKFSVPYVTDSTNLTTDYTRNKIRHLVVPVLKEINPSVNQSFARFMLSLSEDFKFIEDMTLEYKKLSIINNGYSSDKIRKMPPSLCSRVIFSICEDYDIILDNKKYLLIKNILATGGAVELNKRYRAVCKQGLLRIVDCTKISNNIDINFFDNNVVFTDNKQYNINVLNISDYKKTSKINNLLFKNSLDYDTIGKDAVFRHRKSGDKFLPISGNGSKTLKKYFNELKIPSENRDNIILLASGNNIIWIDGIGVSKSHTVKNNTEKVAVITIKECKE